jgi:hypothetical protein
VIEPALARGDVVLCDRFTDATFAYQGAGRGFDLQVLAQLERWVQGSRRCPPARCGSRSSRLVRPAAGVAAQRLAGARAPDRFESQPLAFFARVAQGYADRAQAEPGASPACRPTSRAKRSGPRPWRPSAAGGCHDAPWIAGQARQLLAQRGHAWLLQGPSGLGQYSLALALAGPGCATGRPPTAPAASAAAAMPSTCAPMPTCAC